MRSRETSSGRSRAPSLSQGTQRRRARTTVEALEQLDEVVHRSISRRIFPACVVACGQPGVGCLQYFAKGYGTHTYDMSTPCTTQSIFDVASLTKVMATVPAVMLLYEAGLIDLDAPVAQYIPEFGQNGKEGVTVKHVMTHTAGLHVFYPFHTMGIRSQKEIEQYIFADKLRHPIGETHYSDLSMIVIGVLVERVSGRPLDKYVKHAIFRPLGMHSTGFRPTHSSSVDPSIVPTEVNMDFRKRALWGEVHDPNAYLMGGVAGHAGLFSTVGDMARFCYVFIMGGVTPDGRRLFQEKTVEKFTSRVKGSRGETHLRALGWDMKPINRKEYTSSGSFMSSNAFGHTGYTGTSMWLDPRKRSFVIMLSNAVHPWAGAEPLDELAKTRAQVADAAMDLLAVAANPFSKHMNAYLQRHQRFQAMCNQSRTISSPIVPASAGPEGLLSSSEVSSQMLPAQVYEPSHSLQLEHYKVQSGDRVLQLASQRSMSLQEVAHLNPEVELDNISVGQHLWLVLPHPVMLQEGQPDSEQTKETVLNKRGSSQSPDDLGAGKTYQHALHTVDSVQQHTLSRLMPKAAGGHQNTEHEPRRSGASTNFPAVVKEVEQKTDDCNCDDITVNQAPCGFSCAFDDGRLFTPCRKSTCLCDLFQLEDRLLADVLMLGKLYWHDYLNPSSVPVAFKHAGKCSVPTSYSNSMKIPTRTARETNRRRRGTGEPVTITNSVLIWWSLVLLLGLRCVGCESVNGQRRSVHL